MENNILESIILVEYINLLSYISNNTINKNFEGRPFKMNFSYIEAKNILNANISYELFESFITKNILSHRTLGDKKATFLDICLGLGIGSYVPEIITGNNPTVLNMSDDSIEVLTNFFNSGNS